MTYALAQCWLEWLDFHFISMVHIEDLYPDSVLVRMFSVSFHINDSYMGDIPWPSAG